MFSGLAGPLRGGGGRCWSGGRSAWTPPAAADRRRAARVVPSRCGGGAAGPVGERGRRSKDRWRRSSQRPAWRCRSMGPARWTSAAPTSSVSRRSTTAGRRRRRRRLSTLTLVQRPSRSSTAYRLDRPAPAQGLGLAEPGVIPRPVAHQPAVGPAGGRTPRVAVTGPGETEQLYRAQIVGAGVEQAAQLGVELHGAGGGVDPEQAAGEGAAVAGPPAGPVLVPSPALRRRGRGRDGGVEQPAGLAEQLHDAPYRGQLPPPGLAVLPGPPQQLQDPLVGPAARHPVAGPHRRQHRPQIHLGLGLPGQPVQRGPQGRVVGDRHLAGAAVSAREGGHHRPRRLRVGLEGQPGPGRAAQPVEDHDHPVGVHPHQCAGRSRNPGAPTTAGTGYAPLAAIPPGSQPGPHLTESALNSG